MIISDGISYNFQSCNPKKLLPECCVLFVNHYTLLKPNSYSNNYHNASHVHLHLPCIADHYPWSFNAETIITEVLVLKINKYTLTVHMFLGKTRTPLSLRTGWPILPPLLLLHIIPLAGSKERFSFSHIISQKVKRA